MPKLSKTVESFSPTASKLPLLSGEAERESNGPFKILEKSTYASTFSLHRVIGSSEN